MEKFEGVYIGYMLNQAHMPFFRISAYPHYKVENDTLVHDDGPESKKMREEAAAILKLIKRVQDRFDRGVRIPRTWIRTIEEQTTFVLALEQQRVAAKEWCEEFHRTVRWLKTLTA